MLKQLRLLEEAPTYTWACVTFCDCLAKKPTPKLFLTFFP